MMQDCDTALENMRFFEGLMQKASGSGVPVSGSLELTKRCNLRCVHCYQGDARGGVNGERREMPTDKVIDLLNEIRDAGCLFLLMTGGEPLVRSDFRKIYEHAKRNGMLVTLFTNATLLTEQIKALFNDLPPYKVEVSLYGASAEVYERVSGIPGSFKACIRGIEELLKLGIPVHLKTILMSLNRSEFVGIENLAKSYGVPFRLDATIFPRFDGDRLPLQLRVPFGEALERELSDKERFSSWREFYERRIGVRRDDSLYICGAGTKSFFIDALGYLTPCVMVRTIRFDLSEGRFSEGWRKMRGIRDQKFLPGHRCSGCEAIEFCGYCPAFFQLENGDETVPSEYLCSMGRERFKAISL